jgi:NADPH:quinone reductase-like Zn-dependent oxidoreductase
VKSSGYGTPDGTYPMPIIAPFRIAAATVPFTVARADKVAPIPKRLDLRHAGAIPTTGLTALQGIDDALGLKKGETIIIHGASGGVGTLAVQFARIRGARVFATASGKEGVELVREMGAHAAVDGKRPMSTITRVVLRWTASMRSWLSPAETGWNAA